MHHIPLAFQCIYGYSDEESADGHGKEGSETPGGGKSGDYLVSCMQITLFCGESEEDLRVMVGRSVKVNTGKSKVILLNGEEGLECEVHVAGIRLEHVSELKYFGCVLDESGTDGA